MLSLRSLLLLSAPMMVGAEAAAAYGTAAPGAPLKTVTVDNFVRAESDMYFAKAVHEGAFGTLRHTRQTTPLEEQSVVRMNRDTLYSQGVFDFEAGALTITLPDTGKRFMSLQVVSEDYYTTEVVYAPGHHRYDKARVGTRYVCLIIRTLANPEDAADVRNANAAQDRIRVEQAGKGRFEIPKWDPKSQDKVRDALNNLAALRGSDLGATFGAKNQVNPVNHLLGTAIGWGGNPPSAAIYVGAFPKHNDGKTVHRLNVKDVPVDGFWSISVYNDKGFFEKNELGVYSLNSLTAKPGADGSYTVQFGGCHRGTPNCLPIMAGWNYTVRLYRPRQPILDGRWKFPAALPVT